MDAPSGANNRSSFTLILIFLFSCGLPFFLKLLCLSSGVFQYFFYSYHLPTSRHPKPYSASSVQAVQVTSNYGWESLRGPDHLEVRDPSVGIQLSVLRSTSTEAHPKAALSWRRECQANGWDGASGLTKLPAYLGKQVLGKGNLSMRRFHRS